MIETKPNETVLTFSTSLMRKTGETLCHEKSISFQYTKLQHLQWIFCSNTNCNHAVVDSNEAAFNSSFFFVIVDFVTYLSTFSVLY